MSRRPARIMVRVVKSPVDQRGQVLVLLPESRQINACDVLAYSLVREEYLIENLRHLMDRTRAADPHAAAEARRQFEYIYGAPVRLTSKANPYDGG